MKFILIAFVSILVISTAIASTINPQKDLRVPIDLETDSRLETIGDHTFFVLDLSNEEIALNYGDKVKLVFGINSAVIVYNLSGNGSKKYNNKSELVVFIDPDYLRCFKNKSLRKIIIYSEGKPVKIKTNLQADQLEIK